MTKRPLSFDVLFRVHSPADAPKAAKAYEDWGVDGLWAAEKDHDPYLLLALAGNATKKVKLGTAIALAFNRSPMSIASTAWDLQMLSQGRFVIGLGTQVRAHIERRFSASWDMPVKRMREAITSLKTIWNTWKTGEELNFQGEFYKFSLMTPAFTPPPMPYPAPPIYLGGVNAQITQLAGELCDGFHVHPFHTIEYLRETLMPNLAKGADKAGRDLDDITICSSAFCIMGDTRQELETTRESVRQQLSFYASTKAYRKVLEVHGWDDVGVRLGKMAAQQQWQDMPALITDEMIDAFAITGSTGEMADLLKEKYAGLLDRVAINSGPEAGSKLHDERLLNIARSFHE